MNNAVFSSLTALVAAYVLGSIPTAYLVGRLKKHPDIRQEGSHNMGAMNVFYSVGFLPGLTVLIGDIAKGALAVLLADWLSVPFFVQLTAGGIAVIGHMFPVFLKFRGGKGGAVSIGVFSALMPQAIPYGVGIFLLALLVTRFPTLSYSLALACAPFIAWLIYHSGTLVLFSVILLLMLLARYLPRIAEMRSSGGNWRHVFLRRSLKDRF